MRSGRTKHTCAKDEFSIICFAQRDDLDEAERWYGCQGWLGRGLDHTRCPHFRSEGVRRIRRPGGLELTPMGLRLIREAERLGLGLKELSAKAGLGRNTVDGWCYGASRQPKPVNLAAVAKVLGVEPERLVEGEVGR